MESKEDKKFIQVPEGRYPVAEVSPYAPLEASVSDVDQTSRVEVLPLQPVSQAVESPSAVTSRKNPSSAGLDGAPVQRNVNEASTWSRIIKNKRPGEFISLN
jgi:hypothetical protein